MTRAEALKVQVGDELRVKVGLNVGCGYVYKGTTFVVRSITKVNGCPQFRANKNHIHNYQYATPSQVEMVKTRNDNQRIIPG